MVALVSLYSEMNTSSVQPFQVELEHTVNQQDKADDSTRNLCENKDNQRGKEARVCVATAC